MWAGHGRERWSKRGEACFRVSWATVLWGHPLAPTLGSFWEQELEVQGRLSPVGSDGRLALPSQSLWRLWAPLPPGAELFPTQALLTIQVRGLPGTGSACGIHLCPTTPAVARLSS